MKNILFCISILVFLIVSGSSHAGEFDFSKVTSYYCTGTEPFWKLEISQGQIVYDPLGEGPKVPIGWVKPDNAVGIKEGFVRVYRTRTKDKGEPVDIVVKYTGNCSDEMSDYSYKYENTIIFKDKVLIGCCDPR